MTRPRQQFTDKDYRARLLRLKELSIPIRSATDPPPEPERLILEQIDPEFATLYELPSLEVIVVAPARMTVLMSGVLIIGLEMTTSLDDYPLDLSHPGEWGCYKDVIDQLPLEPTILNDLLTEGLPLRPRQMEGVILAKSSSRVPAQCHDLTPITVGLLLTDERYNEISTKFEVRLDRSLMRKHEAQLRIRRDRLPLTRQRGGLYAPEAGPPGDQKSGAPEKAIKPGLNRDDDNAKYGKPN